MHIKLGGYLAHERSGLGDPFTSFEGQAWRFRHNSQLFHTLAEALDSVSAYKAERNWIGLSW